MRSYDAAPRPPSPFFRQQIVSLSQSFCVSPVQLTGGRGGLGRGGGRGADRNKARASINRSILSGGEHEEKGGLGASFISILDELEYAKKHVTLLSI